MTLFGLKSGLTFKAKLHILNADLAFCRISRFAIKHKNASPQKCFEPKSIAFECISPMHRGGRLSTLDKGFII